MKTVIAILLLFVGINLSYCQNDEEDVDNRRAFHSIKGGVLSDINITPFGLIDSSTTIYLSNNVDSTFYEYGQLTALSIFSLVYTFRYSIIEPTKNIGLGINVAPRLGYFMVLGKYIDNPAKFGFNLPVYLSANFGAGSTHKLSNDFGGFIGVGYEYTDINLFNSSFNDNKERINPKTTWTEPVFIVGVRWWTNKYQLFELSFKYGYSSNRDDLPPANEIDPSQSFKSAKTFQLVWGIYIGY